MAASLCCSCFCCFFFSAKRLAAKWMRCFRLVSKAEARWEGEEKKPGLVFVLSRLPREVCPLIPLLSNLTIPNGKVNERQPGSNSGCQNHGERARTPREAWLPAPLLAGGAGWAPARTRKLQRGRSGRGGRILPGPPAGAARSLGARSFLLPAEVKPYPVLLHEISRQA